MSLSSLCDQESLWPALAVVVKDEKTGAKFCPVGESGVVELLYD